MTTHRTTRSVGVGAMLLTAALGGALAGFLAACFIWAVESLTELVWVDVPDRLGVDPYGSWWLLAVPLAGGVLVGLGQRFLGNYPEPIERNVARWRADGQVAPRTVVPSALNALTALVAGGPVGFEAALTGVIGGIATVIGDRIRAVRTIVATAWGADPDGQLPATVRRLPVLVAALSGLLVYRWLPFGAIDLGFRLEEFDGDIGIVDGLGLVAFAALVAVPTAWAISVVRHAEDATWFRRSPVLIAMLGGAAFALLAAVHEFVLFSGQEAISHLDELDTGEQLYLTVAKWIALVIALLAGWRGGPIFPMVLAVASLAAAVDGVIDVPTAVVTAAGIAAVSVVFTRGGVIVAFVLTLYVVPLSFAGIILLGAVAAAAALAAAGSLGAMPRPPEQASG